jgi:hypothetical protein
VIGGPNRLLEASPHSAELLESKAAYAAPAFLPDRFRKLSLAQVNARIEQLKTSIGE